MVSPGRFIPVAEETGQIRALGAWSLRVACEQMAEWIARDIPVPTVSVNMSAIQFQDPELVSQLATILHQTGVPPERLIVELTETAMIENFDQTVTTATAIRNLGIGLSMDDFGTGYSSLSNLASLPISEVKIDRSFMNGFGSTGNVRQVVTAIIRIGHTLGMTVIAEGVEDAAQCAGLRDIDCDVVQGYYFGRPMTTASSTRGSGNAGPKPSRSPDTHHNPGFSPPRPCRPYGTGRMPAWKKPPRSSNSPAVPVRGACNPWGGRP